MDELPQACLFEPIIPLDADNVSKANNIIIKTAKEKMPDVDFIHIFQDDVIVNEKFNVEKYETFMREYDLGYYFNPRLSPLNYVYETVSPRLIIATEKYAEANVNVYAFDAREYVVIDCKKNNELFNEEVKYLYNIEYIYRCSTTGNIPFLNFYFDNSILDGDVSRDEVNFPRKQINHNDYTAEEQVLVEKFNVNWVPHSNADDVINYFKKCKHL
jgi:hypothetical protein